MQNITEGKLVLTKKEEVARSTLLLTFEVQSDSPFTFEAGQFVSLKFGDTSWRAYSIASVPNEEALQLVVRLVPDGLASGIFDESSIGDTFGFKGPFGRFILSDDVGKKLIFCATGTGIAPIRSMILQEQKKEDPRPMELWYGGRDSEDIAYLDEVQNWGVDVKLAFSKANEAQNPHSHYELNDDQIEVFDGRITQFIEEHGCPKDGEYYICGNGDMVKSIEGLLLDSGVEKKHIHKERFN